MTEPLDDSLEKLKAFCDLLRTTNPQLASGASELHQLAQTLDGSESSLASDLDGLVTELDELHKEAESSEATVVKACQELGTAGDDARTVTLLELAQHVGGVHDEWGHTLQDKAAALSAAFQDLTASGWQPLIDTLASVGGDAERWLQTADGALATAAGAFDGAVTQTAHHLADATAAFTELAHEVDANEEWQEPSLQAHKAVEETLPSYRSENLGLIQELGAAYHEAGDAGAAHARAQLEMLAEKAADAIDALSNEVAEILGPVTEALEKAQVESERSAVQADEVQAAAHALTTTGGQVLEGDHMITEIHAILEGLSQE